jgi:hypothetical protein
MWLLHRRARLPHFRNNANNMLETSFGKFKDAVKKDMSMAPCVKELVASARRTENDTSSGTIDSAPSSTEGMTTK